MFKKLLKKLNRDAIRTTDEYEYEVSSKLSEMKASVLNIMGESDDVNQRSLKFGQYQAIIFYIDGLCNEETLESDVIKPILRLSKPLDELKHSSMEEALQRSMTLSSFSIVESFDEVMLPVLSGDALLIVDGFPQLIVLGTRGFNQRSIEEPQSEIVVRGPRDGFIETLQTNIVLLRRRVKDPNLVIQTGQVGRRSKKSFALAYLKGVVNPDLVEEIRYRVACVDTDDIAESGTLEQFIEDNVLSPFPQMLHTERPDKAVASLLNGHVIILVDGTPFVLLAPVTFQQLLKSPEDYYDRWHIGTLLRLLRYLASLIAIILPALYIAMVSFHHGMIPTTLALSIAGAREGVPFPAFIEALMMEITLELLREAGVRLPRAVGQTVGIVGGLVIGDAAVRAGIVSPIMVIVVALTAIASFAIPSYNVSITFRMIRFGCMIAAACFGLFGIILVYILINIHLVGLRSFGSYYTSPFAPYRFLDWLDLLFRAPLTLHRVRSDEPRTLDNKKQN